MESETIVRPATIGKGWEKEAKILPTPKKLSNTEVLETNHYEWFNMNVKNRPISEDRVHAFMREFKKGNFFMKDFPAVVDGNYTIIDGQPRFEAARRMELPFYFRIATEITLEKVTVVQTNSGWKVSDYIHAYIKQGNQNYVVLSRFMKRYEITAMLALELIKGYSSSGMQRIGFYAGTLNITDKEEANGHRRCKAAREILDLVPNANIGNDGRYYRACIRLVDHEEYDHKRMVSQLKKYASLFQRQVSTQNYLKNFEEVFNYKLYTKNKVRFS